MSDPTSQQKPDWIMLGVPRGDQFAIYASTDLNEAELRQELLNERYLYADMGGSPFYQRTGIPAIYLFTITATMNTFVMVVAPTYADALRSLLTQWQPKPRERQQIEAPSKIIGGGLGV